MEPMPEIHEADSEDPEIDIENTIRRIASRLRSQDHSSMAQASESESESDEGELEDEDEGETMGNDATGESEYEAISVWDELSELIWNDVRPQGAWIDSFILIQ